MRVLLALLPAAGSERMKPATPSPIPEGCTPAAKEKDDGR